MVGKYVGGPLSHSVDYCDKKEGDYASFDIALFRSLKANYFGTLPFVFCSRQ